MSLTFVGLLTGLGLALALARLATGFLFGVHPADPLTFAVVVLVLTGVAYLANYIPARRATRIDPMIALRSE